MIIKQPQCTVNGVDLSSFLRHVEVLPKKTVIEDTASNDGGTHRESGLNDDSFVLKFKQSYGTGNVDKTLWPLFDAGTEFEVHVSQDPIVSDTSPAWEGNCLLQDYSPITGDIGALNEVSVTFVVQGKIARVTT